MSLLLWFLLGAVAGQFAPERARAWVRGAVLGAWRWVRDGASASPASAPAQLMASAPNKPIQLGALMVSVARNWRLIAVLVVAGLVVWGCSVWDGPFGIAKSRDALALEARLAAAEAQHQEALRELDARIAEIQREAALNRQRIALISERGHDDIEAARPADETVLDAQSVRAWRGAIERLRDNAGSDKASADPGGGGVTG